MVRTFLRTRQFQAKHAHAGSVCALKKLANDVCTLVFIGSRPARHLHRHCCFYILYSTVPDINSIGDIGA